MDSQMFWDVIHLYTLESYKRCSMLIVLSLRSNPFILDFKLFGTYFEEQ